jgi:hypothetical protein
MTMTGVMRIEPTSSSMQPSIVSHQTASSCSSAVGVGDASSRYPQSKQRHYPTNVFYERETPLRLLLLPDQS